MSRLLIKTQFGLGDCIYHRPFIKQMTQRFDAVYLETPWPELYKDLPVKFVRPQTTLRTQQKNIERQTEYVEPPRGTGHIRPHYIAAQDENMLQGLSRAYGLPVTPMDLPNYPALLDTSGKPYLVVRPATVRREWPAPARNPRPEYIARFVERAREFYHVVSVADLQQGEEYAVEPLPYADTVFHHGELNATQLLGLIQHADLVVGGVGFIVPACIALKTPLVCIFGGNGGYNALEKITHRLIDTSMITAVVPDNFCRCTKMNHECDKRIANFDQLTEAYFANFQPVLV